MGLFDDWNPLSIVGDVLQYSGAKDERKVQNQMAQDQRDWEEKMSNSAYSRAVSDMKNAGLNPALAYSQGGASTPSVGIGGSTNVFEGVGSSANEIHRAHVASQQRKKDFEVADSVIDKNKADADLTRAGIPNVKWQNQLPGLLNKMLESIKSGAFSGKGRKGPLFDNDDDVLTHGEKIIIKRVKSLLHLDSE